MILYFSGTGNSEYVAKRIGKEINDEAVNLFDKIRNKDTSEMTSECPWVVVVPTYAWRIPRIVQEWLEKTNFVRNTDIYFVMTCGGSIGNAGKYLEKLCSKGHELLWVCRNCNARKLYSVVFLSHRRTGVSDYRTGRKCDK